MLLDEIKQKKEFRFLSDDFVSRVLVQCSTKYDVRDEKQKKLLVKKARSELRELYGAFRLKGYDKRYRFLEKMAKWDDEQLCEKILSLHLSTKERVSYYPIFYDRLRQHISFRSVLDLGCGFNVFSLPWMGKVFYFGVDVNKEDVDFCNAYLEKFKLGGGVRWGDLLSFDKFLYADVTFLFKVLEGLERVEHGVTEEFLEKIPSPYIVVSFATQSLGGKKHISPKRLKWFENIVTIVDKFNLGNEVYYIIKRKV